MDISLKFIGPDIVEFSCQTTHATITEDITNLQGYVSIDFIENLKSIVEELEKHNESKLNNQ